MSTLSLVTLILIFIELIVALVFSYGLHGNIYREEKTIGLAMKRLKLENPVSALIVNISYALIVLEFVLFILLK